MNAALKLPDWDRSPSLSETTSNAAHQFVLRVMLEAAASTSLQALDGLMRFHGANLVEALTEVTESGPASSDKQSLEERLIQRGVRQNILDNLELSTLHSRRGLVLLEHTCARIAKTKKPVQEQVLDRLQRCACSQWEYFFGLTFLACIAAGLISENGPGVDVMLGWMRSSSRQAYVHAAAADEHFRSAA